MLYFSDLARLTANMFKAVVLRGFGSTPNWILIGMPLIGLKVLRS